MTARLDESSKFPEPVPERLRGPEPSEAWIGLGSNLGDREANLRRAAESFAPRLVAVSSFYETAPWGIPDQPWFLNAVLRLNWTGSPRELLDRCLATERVMGRIRGEKNGPRVIDLDVLMVSSIQLEEEGIRVPHRGLSSRRSVLEPWAELAPDLVVPGQRRPLWALRDAAVDLEGQQVLAWKTRPAGQDPQLPGRSTSQAL